MTGDDERPRYDRGRFIRLPREAPGYEYPPRTAATIRSVRALRAWQKEQRRAAAEQRP